MKKFKVALAILTLVLSILLTTSYTTTFAGPNTDGNGDVEDNG